MLSLKNLSVLKNGKVLLKDVSLELESSQVTLLLGKSGAGKSTLLRCIAQIEENSQGEVFYQGISLKTLSCKERCQVLGFVPQSYGLFPHKTVFKNCAEPLSLHTPLSLEEIREKVFSLLKQFGVEELIEMYPHELSGGQKQRVALVRSLLLNPQFILLDEPTSALDPYNTEILIQLIQTWKERGVGWIIATQDIPFAKKILEKGVLLDQGEIVTEQCMNSGKPKNLLDEFLSH